MPTAVDMSRVTRYREDTLPDGWPSVAVTRVALSPRSSGPGGPPTGGIRRGSTSVAGRCRSRCYSPPVQRAVGRNVPRKDAARRSPARRATSTIFAFPACCSAPRSARPSRTAASSRAGWPSGRGSPSSTTATSPAQRRRADRRRPAVPGRATRSATSPSRSCCWRTPIARCWPRRPPARASTTPPQPPLFDPGGSTRSFKDIAIDKGDRRRGLRRRRRDRRGRVPHRASGAALHRDQRRDRRALVGARAAERGRDDGLRIAAVPLLRAPRAGRAARPARRPRARRADRDRRRLRRQGGVPVDDRLPRRAARASRPARR